MKKMIALALAASASLLAACGTVATPEWAAEVQETQAALAVTLEHLTAIAPTSTTTPTPEFTATPAPATATPLPPTATNTVEAATATITPSPVPTQIAAGNTVDGDPVRGKELFNTVRSEVAFACATCHYPDQETRLLGPGLQNVSERAATRVEGMSAYDYIHTSIVNPNAFIVPGDPPYPENLMPQVYGTLWTEQELNDIIAYLFTL